jgi:hypothetical protein
LARQGDVVLGQGGISSPSMSRRAEGTRSEAPKRLEEGGAERYL